MNISNALRRRLVCRARRIGPIARRVILALAAAQLTFAAARFGALS
jgi:hypothetical protein